jgi:hypothetical protein
MPISDEIRANIARAEEAERKRLAAIVEKANAGVNRAVEAREAQEHAAEQERAKALAEREQARIDAAKESYRRALRSAYVGTDAEFDAAFPSLWARHQEEAARATMEQQHYAAREYYRKTF